MQSAYLKLMKWAAPKGLSEDKDVKIITMFSAGFELKVTKKYYPNKNCNSGITPAKAVAYLNGKSIL